MSLLSWERGLKYNQRDRREDEPVVAPLVGAWIEMHRKEDISGERLVAPLVGAWIEISQRRARTESETVAPLVGAWIEMPLPCPPWTVCPPSLLSWERGLKLTDVYKNGYADGSLLSWERGLKYF